MTAKEYLRQAYIIDRKIKLDTERLSEMRAALYGRGLSCESDGSKHVRRGNGFENALLRVMEQEERLDAEIDQLTAKHLEIEKAIAAVPNEVHREVLTRRYLLYQDWKIIADKMNYSERQIYRLHGKALKALEKMSVDVS